MELLAWLTEMLLFQVNQIPEANTRGFLQLLGTAPSDDDLDTRDPDHDAGAERGGTGRSPRPTTSTWLLRTWPRDPEAAALPRVRRVRCVPGRDLTAADPRHRPGARQRDRRARARLGGRLHIRCPRRS